MDEAERGLIDSYYDRGEEQDRLAADARGALEFERTAEIVARHLPAPPALIADVGGGPGRYALWLAGLGYRVEHRDLMPLHVRQLTSSAAGARAITARVGDARNLDLADASADAVLLLGPLYHLRRRADRLAALREARRVVKPGHAVFAAAISRWAPRLDGELRARLYEPYPQVRELVLALERTGWMAPLHEGSFTAFCHRPEQIGTWGGQVSDDNTDPACDGCSKVGQVDYNVPAFTTHKAYTDKLTALDPSRTRSQGQTYSYSLKLDFAGFISVSSDATYGTITSVTWNYQAGSCGQDRLLWGNGYQPPKPGSSRPTASRNRHPDAC